ncbi:hypothetical protein [Micromonospora sp. NPDC003241]
MRAEDARANLQEAATFWSVGSRTAAEVIEAACDCLVAGVDSPTLRILAGLSSTRGGDNDDVRRWLPGALEELGLAVYPEHSPQGEEAAARVMARRLLAATITPSELTGWAHQCVTLDGAPLMHRLVRLDDAYEIAQFTGSDVTPVDAEVRAEARRLVESEAGSADIGP